MENGNLVGLAGAVALSAAMLNPLPLIVAGVAEVAYMLFVPDSRWYMKRIESRFDAEVEKRRRDFKIQVFPQVRSEVRDQFLRLEEMRLQIAGQARKEEPWFQEALRKLDYLMEKYLQFAQKEAQFCSYLMGIYDDVWQQLDSAQRRELPKPTQVVDKPPIIKKGAKRGFEADLDDYDRPPVIATPTDEWVRTVVGTISRYYDQEIEELQSGSEAETVMANKNIMERRAQILVRRREFVGRTGQILTNLGQQMHLMADTFGLINDEIRARSPEQVLNDINEVVTSATSLTEAIDQFTPMDDLVGNLA